MINLGAQQVRERWLNQSRVQAENLKRYWKLFDEFDKTIPAPSKQEFAKALGESALFKEKRFGVHGSRAIVMDAADRNLF